MIKRFQIIQPHHRLRQYIERMFVIESSTRMPSEDLKLIVPNACAKLVIPFRNSLMGRSSEWNHLTKENTIALIGVSDIPAVVDYQDNAPAGNITVEFSPIGAYRFFNFDWRDIKNQIWSYADIAPAIAATLQEKLVNTRTIEDKLPIIEAFLLQQFSSRCCDPIFDYCVQKITSTKGQVTIRELEKYTGYSARWLNMKFTQKIGVSPKNLSSIIRFQQYYKSLVINAEKFFLEKEFYTYYHDQSHFIKDFKRFTGYAPTFLAQSSNRYDKVFYKE